MQYRGKLYGKVAGEYIPLEETAADVDALRARLEKAEADSVSIDQFNRLNQDRIHLSLALIRMAKWRDLCLDRIAGLRVRAEAASRPREAIYAEIETERLRQDAKWGVQNHPIRDEQEAKFYQDQAERWRKICDRNAALGTVTWFNILIEEFFEAFAESDPAKQREELKQVAAVAVAMIECIDRRLKEAHP